MSDTGADPGLPTEPDDSFVLDNGEELHASFPQTFWIPEGNGNTYAFLGTGQVNLIKLGPDGALQWSRPLPVDSGLPIRMVPTPQATLIIGGTNSPFPEQDVEIGEMDAEGQTLWWNTWDSGGRDVLADVAVDDAGQMALLASRSLAPSSFDLVVLRIAAGGGPPLWSAYFDDARIDSPVAIDVDSRGQVFVAGRSRAEELSRFRWLAIEFDPDGQLLWWERRESTSGHVQPVMLRRSAPSRVALLGTTSFDFLAVAYRSAIFLDGFESGDTLRWSPQ